MAGRSIQFRGIDAVLEAFNYKGADLWAVFEGRNLIHKGRGADDLAAWLDMLSKAESNPIYTLKVYEGLDGPGKIKENTPADGSFGFRIHEDAPDGRDGLEERITRKLGVMLDERIGSMQDTEPAEEGVNIGAIVSGYLNDPDKIVALLNGIKNLFMPARPAPAAAVGSLPGPEPAGATKKESMSTEEKMQSLASSLDILEQADPHLVDHLAKLADMAVNKPKQFQMIVGMLDTFK